MEIQWNTKFQNMKILCSETWKFCAQKIKILCSKMEIQMQILYPQTANISENIMLKEWKYSLLKNGNCALKSTNNM